MLLKIAIGLAILLFAMLITYIITLFSESDLFRRFLHMRNEKKLHKEFDKRNRTID